LKTRSLAWIALCITVGVGLLAASLLGVADAPSSPTDVSQVASSPPNASTSRPERRASAAPASAPGQDAAPRASDRSRLLRELNAATSYRAFLARALADARHGGLTYVMYITAECAKATGEGARGAPSQDREAAISLLRARCDFSHDEAWDAMGAATRSNGVSVTDDPGVADTMAYLRRHHDDPRAKLDLAQAVLASDDPLREGQLLYLNSEVSDLDGDALPAYFDGTWYRSETERSRLEDAWLLAQCSLGLDCGAQSLPALELCALRDWCAGSVADALKSGRPEDWDAIAALSARLVVAARSHDARPFVAGR
jgi:hypothetical protein